MMSRAVRFRVVPRRFDEPVPHIEVRHLEALRAHEAVDAEGDRLGPRIERDHQGSAIGEERRARSDGGAGGEKQEGDGMTERWKVDA